MIAERDKRREKVEKGYSERARCKGGARTFIVLWTRVELRGIVGGARWIAMIRTLMNININNAGQQQGHPSSLPCDPPWPTMIHLHHQMRRGMHRLMHRRCMGMSLTRDGSRRTKQWCITRWCYIIHMGECWSPRWGLPVGAQTRVIKNLAGTLNRS